MTPVRSAQRVARYSLGALAMVALAGCGTTLATSPHTMAPAPRAQTSTATPTVAPAPSVMASVPTRAIGPARRVGTRVRVRRIPAAARPSVGTFVGVAARQYAREMSGPVPRLDLQRIASDPGLGAALRSGSAPRLRAYVHAKFASVWSHMHVSRLQILSGSRVVVDEGVPFVVDGPHTLLPSGFGRSAVTLRISIQDEIGFVRLLHRHYPVDVVVRGSGPGQVRTSLPSALRSRLPDRGTVTIAGRRYAVGSLSRTALGGEPVKIWILSRG